MCFSKLRRKASASSEETLENNAETQEEEREAVPLEKHDWLALLLAAYGVFLPIAMLALGVILVIALLLFRVI